MFAILNSLNAHNFPIFSTDFDDACFKIHGSESSFRSNILQVVIRVAVPFKINR